MLIRFALVILALLAVAQWVPGVTIDGLYSAVVVAVLLGIASITIKPLLTILTLPVHILTLGLSAFVVNAFIFWFLSTFIAGFTVEGFIPALLGSLIVAIASALGSKIG